MLLLLPLTAFVLVFLLALGERLGIAGVEPDPRGPFVLALIGWGALVAVFSEGLGALGLLNRTAIALAWLAAGGLLLAIGLRRGSMQRAVGDLRDLKIGWSGWDIGLVAGTGGILLLLLGVALVAPPNNVDSLLYHMSRVMHWAQNGTLRPYAAGYHHQLIMPPWAEMAILHLRTLWGNDQPANLVQWFALVGSILGASAVARLLGGSRSQQLLTAVFAATIPMGVLQATSTQNDMVVGVWVISCAYLVFLDHGRPLGWPERIALGLAFGLGLMTKITFVVYGLPLAVLYVITALRRAGWRRSLASVALIGALACSLNIPIWTRNLGLYGGLYGPPDWMRSNSALIGFVEALPSSPSAPMKAAVSILAWPAQRLAQGAALNLLTPSFALNQMMWGVLNRYPGLFDGVVSHSLEQAAWSHEDTAGNPTHLAMLALALGALGFTYRAWTTRRAVLPYLFTTASGFLLLVTLFNEGVSIFGVRYQLPFFLLSSPLVGQALGQLRAPGWSRAAGVLLLISAVPYLLFNNTRPVIGRPPWPTRVQSVFTASPAELLFAANRDALPGYLAIRDWITASGCRQVGLRLNSGDYEYQNWWLLDAPQSGIRIESVYTYPSLEHLIDDTFQPCAVICTICGSRSELDGLVPLIERGPVRLFVSPDLAQVN